MEDFKKLIEIIKKHYWIVGFIGTFISSLAYAGGWAYNYFAKKDELVRYVCIQKATELELLRQIQIAQYTSTLETMVQLELIHEKDDNSLKLIRNFKKVVEVSREGALLQPHYTDFDKIMACTKLNPPRIEK
jgi:hypothetical protein